MAQDSDPSLMHCLKEATRERHARLETLPFITALTSGELPLESYIGQLRAMSVIQGSLEHELSLSNAAAIKTIWQGRPSRLAHLRRDLSAFDALLVPDNLDVLEHARKIAEIIRRYRVEQPTNLLGILYVLEGTTLGNVTHLPDVLRIFGSQTAGAAFYYAGYGERTHEYWEEFRCAMNAIAIEEQEREDLILAANAFFDQLEALFSALYPIRDHRRGLTASMLNPEAGDHAVPSDVREIEAAVTAARRCREEFPYFDERYKERGQGFAKSDAAWLASLAELPQAQLMGQVEWLGRVLANRGMPRFTLERQLELLYEELTKAVPAKKYTSLLEAAGSLKTERLRLIPEDTFDELTRQFDIATNGELQGGRLKNTGALIVSAVADEANGISGAVTSLLAWLTNTELFSLHWTTAVRLTAERARQILIP
jgi:heme oxygenase